MYTRIYVYIYMHTFIRARAPAGHSTAIHGLETSALNEELISASFDGTPLSLPLQFKSMCRICA